MVVKTALALLALVCLAVGLLALMRPRGADWGEKSDAVREDGPVFSEVGEAGPAAGSQRSQAEVGTGLPMIERGATGGDANRARQQPSPDSAPQLRPAHLPSAAVQDIAAQDRAVVQVLREGTQIERARAANSIADAPTHATVNALLQEAKACADPALRVRFLEAIRRVDGSAYANDLAAVLADLRNGDLRMAVADALVSSGSPAAVRALRELAEANADSERLVRGIGRSLMRFDREESVSELLRNLDSPIAAVQAGSVAALAEIGSQEAVDGLYVRFETSDALRKELIIEGFRRLKDQKSLSALDRIAARTQDADLKAVVNQAIARITSTPVPK